DERGRAAERIPDAWRWHGTEPGNGAVSAGEHERRRGQNTEEGEDTIRSEVATVGHDQRRTLRFDDRHAAHRTAPRPQRPRVRGRAEPFARRARALACHRGILSRRATSPS